MVVTRSTPKATPNSPQLELEEVDNETRSKRIQDRPQKKKPSAAPSLHSLASSTAGRLLTYSMNVSNELMPSGVVLTCCPTLLVYRPNMA
ncbi:hypothetical protein TIFTF001_022430 [Ficus carica]|uniref:Uncharacterized protein n=1 Tax=Ficus carica TaxID=3494 RepID=A0AA88AM07_FICCA|nr:hypothetical protein TIFTF001_022430 [Ficus carica]